MRCVEWDPLTGFIPRPFRPITTGTVADAHSGDSSDGHDHPLDVAQRYRFLHPAMENPTIVVITDRNDLDDQLFGTFARCRDLLRQEPVQAESRPDLRDKLRVSGGGVGQRIPGGSGRRSP